MSAGLGTNGPIIGLGDLFVIRDVGRAAWCKVTTPQGVAPARGAAAAQAMAASLIDLVLQRRSTWLGLVFDVREGPSVFGPLTRSALEPVFERAELMKSRVAVLVGASAIQAEQFEAIARARAPRFAKVTGDPRTALDWMTSTTSDGQ